MNNLQISDLFSQLASEYKNMPNTEHKPVRVPEFKEIETLEPEYLNPQFKSSIVLPRIYRFNQSGLRYYFAEQDGEIKFYPSVTTIIEKTTEMSPGLKRLLAEMGTSDYYAFMRERAHYGTLLHLMIADYLRNGKNFDTDSIPSRLADYVIENNIRFNTDRWGYELNKDLRALVQFVNDYDVEPLAIELIGYYDDGAHRFAGAIDLLCYMTIEEKGFFGEFYKSGKRKGEPKETKESRRVLAIVDFKSGKSDFHVEHEIQLNMYKLMCVHSLGISPEKVYNVSPKDWESQPTYSIKDQTDSQQAARIPFLLGSFSCIWNEPKNILIMSGKLNGGNMEDCTKWVSASDWVLSKLGILKKEDPQELVEKAQKAISNIDKTLKNGNGKAQKEMPAVMVEFGKAMNVGFEDCTVPKDELHEIAVQLMEKRRVGGAL